MDLIHGLADLSNLAPDLGTRLTGRSRFFFKLFVSLIGRFFIADRIRFFFVDGLFFQGPRGGKNRDLRLANRRRLADPNARAAAISSSSSTNFSLASAARLAPVAAPALTESCRRNSRFQSSEVEAAELDDASA